MESSVGAGTEVGAEAAIVGVVGLAGFFEDGLLVDYISGSWFEGFAVVGVVPAVETLGAAKSAAIGSSVMGLYVPPLKALLLVEAWPPWEFPGGKQSLWVSESPQPYSF